MRDENPEGEIIKELAAQSILCVYEPMKSEAYNEGQRRNALSGVVSKLQRLLGRRLRVYMQTIVNRLFDPEVQIGGFVPCSGRARHGIGSSDNS
jgi:hypothetical protein